MSEHQFDRARETMGYPGGAGTELTAPDAPTVTDPVCAAIADLVDGLQADDVTVLAGEDKPMLARLADVSVLIDRLDAERLRLLRAAEQSGVLQRDGYTNPSVWLRKATHLTAAEATRRGRVTRRLDALPELTDAHAAGTIGVAHLSELDRLAVHVGIDNVAAVQRPLLVAATHLRDVAEFSKLCTGWRHAFEPDYLDERDCDNHQRRRAGLSVLDGRGHLWGDFDAEATALIQAAITAFTTLDGPDTPEDAYRTPAQRTADAITDMAARILDAADTPIVAGARPHVTVRITTELIAGLAAAHYAEIDGIGAVGRATALRFLNDCSLTRLICDPRSQPLDVGTATRTWPTGLRKAITERDRHCRFPGCDRPPQYCDIDHIHQVEDGGSTSIDNGILLCRTHHRIKHPNRWWPTLNNDATVTWTHPQHQPRTTRPAAHTRQWIHTLLNWPHHDNEQSDHDASDEHEGRHGNDIPGDHEYHDSQGDHEDHRQDGPINDVGETLSDQPNATEYSTSHDEPTCGYKDTGAETPPAYTLKRPHLIDNTDPSATRVQTAQNPPRRKRRRHKHGPTTSDPNTAQSPRAP